MNTQLIESLKKCEVSGNVVKLPAEHLANYSDVRKALLNAGATYKRNTFVFKTDAQPYMDRLTGGDSVNIKKEGQFYATPPDVAEWMVRELHYHSGQSILEPSAGEGALIDAFIQEHGGKAGIELFYIEKDHIRNKILRDKYKQTNFYHLHPDGDDFLNLATHTFDRILANPPFAKNQDIDHIRKMWNVLKWGGRIVTVASNHWQIASGKKEREFKQWIEDVDAGIFPLDSGRFKSSGTMVSACILVIDKPTE